jgi:hypothetical protein
MKPQAMRVSSQPAERRHFGRRQTCVHATILARGRSPIPCVMRDVSEGGALLEVSRPEWLPARFRLMIEANGFAADCEVMHRTAEAVGVCFAAPMAFPG